MTQYTSEKACCLFNRSGKTLLNSDKAKTHLLSDIKDVIDTDRKIVKTFCFGSRFNVYTVYLRFLCKC